MKKLNKVIYNKLLLQAEEAKEFELKKIANGVINAIGSFPRDEIESFSEKELKQDIYDGLWKLAMNVISYHDLESADIMKINASIEDISGRFINELETTLGVVGKIGPQEPKVFGQK